MKCIYKIIINILGDQTEYSASVNAVYGGDGNDALYVQDIRGLENIQLHGGAGHDWLSGDNNEGQYYYSYGTNFPTDTRGAYLFGGTGNDELLGTLRKDTLEGGADNDLIFAYEGDDFLNGGTGNDYALAGAGDDIVLGEAGADTVMGEEGADYLMGGEGNDELFGYLYK